MIITEEIKFMEHLFFKYMAGHEEWACAHDRDKAIWVVLHDGDNIVEIFNSFDEWANTWKEDIMNDIENNISVLEDFENLYIVQNCYGKEELELLLDTLKEKLCDTH